MHRQNKKSNKQTKTSYQRKFQWSDIVWLAGEYQRRCDSEPSLALEDFAIEYGVSVDSYILLLSGMAQICPGPNLF